MAGFEQIQPICFRGRTGILVRVDMPRIERFQFDRGENALESFGRRAGRSIGGGIFDRMIVEGRLLRRVSAPRSSASREGSMRRGYIDYALDRRRVDRVPIRVE